MEKKRKAKFKKIIAILCVFALLQSYFVWFAEIAIAIDEALIENEIIDSSAEDETEEANSDDEDADSEEIDSSEESEEVSESEVTEEINTDEELQENSKEEETETVEEATETSEENISEDTNSEEVTQEADDKISTSDEEKVQESEEENSEEATENDVEPAVTIEVTSENANIYKGYLYANATSDLQYATNYNTIDNITIVGGKSMSSVTVQDEPDKIVFITNEKTGLFNDMCYRKTRISVEEFNTVLGEDGSITLYTAEGEIIGYINKDTEVENDEYVFVYETELNSVKFEFTNIIGDGKVSIKNDKTIKDTSDYSRAQIGLFSSINTIAQVNMYIGEEVKTATTEGNINLEETESRMLIDIDTDTLSVETNNEIAISVTLKTDEEKYDLFENPTIDLEFPSSVESIDIIGATLLYNNGLSIDKCEIIKNELGRKVIRMSLAGAQLEYTPGGAQQGTTLVIYANVGVNRLTADTTASLRMTYTNKDTVRKTYALEGKEAEEVLLKFVGRQELVRALSATETDNGAVSTIDDKTEMLQVSANKEQEQIVTLKGTFLNNYEATLQNLVVIGKIPFVGNLDGNGYSLGTNFDTVLSSALVSTGSLADIYYSEDGEAKADSTSWTTDVTDISKYKSFKIVPKEKTFAKGEIISFEYNVTVPAMLVNNAIGYSNYNATYKIDTQTYTDNCTVGLFTEMKAIEIEDIAEDSKEDVAELLVGTQVSQSGRILKDGENVKERQVLKYSVVVTNNSNKALSNIKLKANAENANLYTWVVSDLEMSSTGEVKEMQEITDDSKLYEEFSIERLEAGESRTFEYQVIVKEDAEEVYGNLIVSADEIEERNITTLKNPVEEAEVEVRFSRATTQSTDDIYNRRDSIYRYDLYVENLTDKDLKNVKLYVNIPKGITVNKNDISYFTKDGFAYGKAKGIELSLNDNNVMIFDIKKLSVEETINIGLNASIDDFNVDTEFVTYRMNSIVETEENQYYSNEVIEKFYQDKTKVEYTWTSDQNKEMLDNGDEVNFELNLKNIGLNDIAYLKFDSKLPKGFRVNSITYNNGEEKNVEIEQDDDNYYIVNFSTYLEKDKNLSVKVNATYIENLTDIDQNILEINSSVKSSQLEEDILTDIISYDIIPRFTSETEIEVPVENEELSQSEDNKENSNNENVDNSTEVNSNDSDEDISNTENNNDNLEEDISDNSIDSADNNFDNETNINDSTSENSNNQNSNKGNAGNNKNQNNKDKNTNKKPNKVTNNEEKVEETNDTVQTKEEKVYIISGMVWLDSNRDGIKQKDEKGKKDEKVSLYVANENGGIDISKKVATVTTNDDGVYRFENVIAGSYVAMLEYNSELYNITKYQVEGAKQDENSDVISKMISVNNENKLVAVTDILTLTETGLINIDMGLTDKNLFDLSLKKYIVKATVKNDKGTKEYEFDNSTNSKLEISAKDYKSSVVDITYKMVVKNEGEVAGYVNKIVDYLPNGVAVNLNASDGWYIGTDKGLYYNGLVGNEIKPGETREFTLVLTKNLSDGESVTIENKAEIAETTNAYSMKDKDSTEWNKLDEDDLGKATLKIVIATGKTAQYLIRTLIAIVSIGMVSRIIIKKKNTKKFYK